MTAILILVGIVVVIIGTIVLVTVPVTHAEAAARAFAWSRSVHIGTRVWVSRKSKRLPKASADIRNVKVHNAGDPDKIHDEWPESGRGYFGINWTGPQDVSPLT